MAQANFGVGIATFVPAASAADTTPVVAAELQEVQLDYSQTEVDLEGDKGFPIARAFGKRKLSGKAKAAKLTAALIAAGMDGSAITTGSKLFIDETATVATHAVTVAGSATWTDDLGVFDSTGAQYSKVASAPVGLQYTVTAGVYGFETGTQDGKALKFRYLKTQTGGKTITLTNPLTGVATLFGLQLFNRSTQNGALTLGATIFAVTIPKFSLPFKSDSWTIPDIEFTAVDDGSGNVVKLYTAV